MAELYDALQKTMMDPLFGMGAGLMTGQTFGQGLQTGLANAQTLQAQAFRQDQAIQEMVNRAEYLKLANEEAARKRKADQLAADTLKQNMIIYGDPDPTSKMRELRSAGLEGDVYQKALYEAVMKPDTNINIGKAPTGYTYINPNDPSAGVTRLPGMQFTEAQLKSANFADRMVAAREEIATIEDFDPASVSTMMLNQGPNWMRPADQQRYNTAKDAWIRAHLRKESGAVIGDQEQIDEETTYFPQPGDSAEVIDFKRRLREREEQSFIKSSSGAYTPKPPPGFTEPVE